MAIAVACKRSRRPARREDNFAWRDLVRRDAVSEDSPTAQYAKSFGVDVDTYLREAPGLSAFALEDRVVYHTYSTTRRAAAVSRGAASQLRVP